MLAGQFRYFPGFHHISRAFPVSIRYVIFAKNRKWQSQRILLCNLSTKWQKNCKTANFNKLAGNGLKMNFDEKKIFGAQAKMTFWDLA